MSDAYQDELWSLYRRGISDLPYVANTDRLMTRSASPVSNDAHNSSPFRESSQFAEEGVSSSQSGSAGNTRLPSVGRSIQQQEREDYHANAEFRPPSGLNLNPKQIVGPEETLLDYDNIEEDDEMPATAVAQQYPFVSNSRRQSSSIRRGPNQTPELPAQQAVSQHGSRGQPQKYQPMLLDENTIRMMDRLEFPRSLLNLANNARVPDHVKQWGQLKQWAVQNSPPGSSNKIMGLQSIVYQQKLAHANKQEAISQAPLQDNQRFV